MLLLPEWCQILSFYQKFRGTFICLHVVGVRVSYAKSDPSIEGDGGNSQHQVCCIPLELNLDCWLSYQPHTHCVETSSSVLFSHSTPLPNSNPRLIISKCVQLSIKETTLSLFVWAFQPRSVQSVSVQEASATSPIESVPAQVFPSDLDQHDLVQFSSVQSLSRV